MEASDAKRLKDLEEENSRLKKMYADVAMENQIQKDLSSKKWLAPCHTKRPHESLGNKTPYEWKMNLIKNDYALNKIV